MKQHRLSAGTINSLREAALSHRCSGSDKCKALLEKFRGLFVSMEKSFGKLKGNKEVAARMLELMTELTGVHDQPFCRAHRTVFDHGRLGRVAPAVLKLRSLKLRYGKAKDTVQSALITFRVGGEHEDFMLLE